MTKSLADDALPPAARSLTLRLLGTMPTLVQDDSSAHSLYTTRDAGSTTSACIGINSLCFSATARRIVDALSAKDEAVRTAAVVAARALLPVSQAFRSDVFPTLLGLQCPQTCSLLDVAPSSAADAEQVAHRPWRPLASLVLRCRDIELTTYLDFYR